MSDLQTLIAEFIEMYDDGLQTAAGYNLRKGLAKLKDSSVPNVGVATVTIPISMAQLVVSGLEAADILDQSKRISAGLVLRSLQGEIKRALSATATEGE